MKASREKQITKSVSFQLKFEVNAIKLDFFKASIKNHQTQLKYSNTKFNTLTRGFGFLGFWGLSPTTKDQKDKHPWLKY